MVSEALIKSEVELLQNYHPKLSYFYKGDDYWVVEGEFDLYDAEGVFWETFSIRIKIPFKYPRLLPIVQEIGGRIEQSQDWHNSVESCCLSPDAVIYSRLVKISVYDWFREFVISYFANFVYRDRFGEYPIGEFSHGVAGIVQGYEFTFNLKGYEQVLLFLRSKLDKRRISRNDLCYCGSQIKYKKCGLVLCDQHREELNIPWEVIESDHFAILNEKSRKSRR